MRPMHKQGVRPEKLSKLSKRVHRWGLEVSIPDDKGAERAERREIERKALAAGGEG